MISRQQVDDLCGSYAAARAEIDASGDPIQRDLALATLRLEAVATYKQLATTGLALPAADVLAPLKEYVANLVGGETSEGWITRAEKFEFAKGKEITSAVVTGVFTGVWAWPAYVATVIIFFGGLMGGLEDLGRNVGAALFVGAIPAILVIRAVQFGPAAAQAAAKGSWQWAESLSSLADRSLQEPRRRQKALWSAAGGRTSPTGLDLAQKAKGYATLGVGTLIAVTLLMLIIFAFGVYEGVTQATGSY